MQLLPIFLLPIIATGTTCLIDCRTNDSQLPTVNTEIEAILGASVGSFSVDFSETCTIPDSTGLVDSTPYSLGYYEFEVERTGVPTAVNVYHGVCPVGLGTAFDYLTVLDSGKISNGNYTYTCATTDFIPDGFYDPLPPVRPQTCVRGILLTPAVPNTFGAAFWTTKQPVVYGFDTTFRFRVLHESALCALEQAANPSQFCYSRGGRGFAFVIQNEGSPGSGGVGDNLGFKVDTIGRVNLGYAFPRNLAIEFDYSFDTDSNDPNWNHIAVMVPVATQPSESDNSNLADHKTNMLAMSDGISLPPLNEGMHSVRIVYDVSNENKWSKLIGSWYSRPMTQDQHNMLTYWSNSRLGVLSVFLDDQPVLSTLVDVALVVQTDPVSTYVPTGVPNEPIPGGAWVGFVAATGPTDFSSPVILDWTFTANPPCPDTEQTVCQIGVVRGDSTPPVVRFTLRNIGRIDVQIFMSLDGQKAYQCQNGFVGWNEVHPYYMGCQRDVAMGPGIQWVSITDTQNMRSVTTSDAALVNRDFANTVFLRRQVAEYCVIEHESDYYRLYLASCDCSFCARIFDNQVLYSIFYSPICSERYTYQCTCFEVSQMGLDTYASDYQTPSNPWKMIGEPGYDFQTKTMQHQIHSVCRGCKYDHHCSLMFKIAVCATPISEYRVGNPLQPTVGGSFENWYRGPDALDGSIKGDNCDCLDSSGEYPYLNTRGASQLFEVWYVSTLKGSVSDCTSCLRLANSDCTNQCNTPTQYSYLHWPSGASCATCTLASASWLDLTAFAITTLRSCVYTAIASGEDPWAVCQSAVALFSLDTTDPVVINARLYQYLNGIATHYLLECPGRDFEDFGAVCAPNLWISDVIPMQAISREDALVSYADVDAPGGIYYPAWWSGAGCVNAICEMIDPIDCYVKIIKIIFSENNGVTECADLFGSGIGCYLENAPSFNATLNNTVIMDRTEQTYGYTAPLDRSVWTSLYGGMQSKTLEVWAQIGAADTITDLAFTYSSGLSASSSWGDDYAPGRALDGDMTTFWQSPTNAGPVFTSVWGINLTSLGELQNAQGYVIYWAYPAVNFTVEASINGGISWSVVDAFGINALTETISSSFFEFNALQVVMTVAGAQRPAGQDADLFAYGIYEIEVFSDSDLARLKPIEIANSEWSYSAALAVDGDLSTWWSTPRGTGIGQLQVLFPAPVLSTVLVRIVFRRGYAPISFTVSTSPDDSVWTALTCRTIGCDVTASFDNFVSSFSLASVTLKGVRVAITQGAAYYDQAIGQIAELTMYQQSATTVTPGLCKVGASLCPGTLPASSLAEYTQWGNVGLLAAGESLGILSITFSGANVASVITVLSPSNTTVVSASTASSSVSFAVFLNDITDITVQILARSNGPTIVSSIHITAIAKIDLTTSTVSSDTAWSATVDETIVQGATGNLIDGNLATEFRTKLGAPSLLNVHSTDPDYQIMVQLDRNIAVDAIFFWYSYLAREFYVGGVSAVASMASPGCEWTQFTVGSTDAVCASVVTQVDTGGYAYVHAMGDTVDFGNTYFSAATLTLSQSSAVDLVEGLTIFGVRELQMFVGYPRIVPAAITLGDANNTGAGSLIDGNFTSYWGRTASVGVTFQLDLGAVAVWVKKIEIWWGSLTGIPTSAVLSVSSAGCSSPVFGAGQTVIVTPSLTAPALFELSSFLTTAVRCVKIVCTGQNYNVSEIIVAGPEASFQAAVIGSSLTNSGNLFDGNTATVATASSGQQYVLFDLATPNLDLWGVTLQFAGSISGLNLGSFVLVFCTNAQATIAACLSSGQQYVLPLVAGKQRYLFEPLACAGCVRVGLQFSGSCTITALQAWASANEALTGATVVFNDDRGWNYTIASAVDGWDNTPWVSEPDVTNAELVVALINDGNGYLVLDPNYATTALARIPMQVSVLTILFMFPICQFAISYSLDGQSWTLLYTYSGTSVLFVEVDEFFSANYLQISLTKAGSDQVLNTIATSVENESWYSSIFGIYSIRALMDTDLSRGKSGASVAVAADADYAITGSVAWISYPPLAQGTYTIFASATDISGVGLLWAVAPLTVELEVQTGVSWSAIALAPYTNASYVLTAAGASGIVGVRVTISAFATFDTVVLAALASMIVYEPASSPISFIEADITDTVMGDNRAYLIDGDLVTNHYSLTTGTLAFAIPAATVVGKIVIVWDAVPTTFSVGGLFRSSGTFGSIFAASANSQSTSTILTTADVSSVQFTFSGSVTIFEITIYAAQVYSPRITQVQTEGVPVQLGVASAIDTPASGPDYTQWMAAVGSSDSELKLDLSNVYQVSTVEITWGFTPWTSISSRDAINALRTVEVSLDDSSYSLVSTESCTYTSKVDTCTLLVSFRYIRITVLASYSAFFGASIKNVEIDWDQDLLRNEASLAVLPNGWWDFPAVLVADGDPTTAWLSRRGETESYVIADLGQVFDLAGIDLYFRYAAGTIDYYWSLDCVSYTWIHGVSGNTNTTVLWSGQAEQFQAMCVKIDLTDPVVTIIDPDNPPNLQAIFGIYTFSIYHHVGGGGVFGIEASVGGIWGTVFDTITFAPFQPNQWYMLSNQQARSEDVNGNFTQEVGLVHIVATFSSDTITLYRNGVQYGSNYTATTIPWDTFDDVRLVFGVRSSAFVGASNSTQTTLMGSDLPGKQTSTLSPYFLGNIMSVALFSQALLAEEVMGLYESAFGMRERGCACYDACPTGSNRIYPTMLVPCSGQGVCRRQYDNVTGLPDGGVCQCSPGFSGVACDLHCSSNGGCCSVDDDCPTDETCNVADNVCVVDP